MKRTFTLLYILLILISCDNNSRVEQKDPATVHPPSEAIPDTLKLEGDSTIVPDSTGDPDVKAKTGAADSVRRE
jgi:hypothetical protein